MDEITLRNAQEMSEECTGTPVVFTANGTMYAAVGIVIGHFLGENPGEFATACAARGIRENETFVCKDGQFFLKG